MKRESLRRLFFILSIHRHRRYCVASLLSPIVEERKDFIFPKSVVGNTSGGDVLLRSLELIALERKASVCGSVGWGLLW